MGRRLAGFAVLVLALTAVAVVPAIDGRRVAGSAIATTFPEPPQVGDCLLPPFPDARRAGLPPEIPVTATRFGSCSDPIAGQIVALWPNTAAGTAAEVAGTEPWSACYHEAADFGGLPPSVTVPGGPPADAVAWKRTIGFDAYHVVPDARERNAGRTWVACLVAPIGHPTYRGTLRDAFTTGTMPAVFGLCFSGHDLDLMPAPLRCDQPHPAELLATGWIQNRDLVTAAARDASCGDIAAHIMHTDDPTRSGAVGVVLDPVRRDGASRPDDPLSVGCFVTTAGPRELNGTLIGLGDRPVPFAG